MLALQLRPGVLDDLGLVEALRWLAEDGRQRLKLAVDLQMDDAGQPSLERHIPDLHETVLFRIAQESLTNAVLNAHTQYVSIALQQEQESIRLRIQDDGCGYDTSKVCTGLGILGMCERTATVGGTLTITSHPGQGTTAEALLPRVEGD